MFSCLSRSVPEMDYVQLSEQIRPRDTRYVQLSEQIRPRETLSLVVRADPSQRCAVYVQLSEQIRPRDT